MREWKIPECKKKRVIIDTDAKNEVDDQFAIAQAVLSQSLDIRGIVAAHFGTERTDTSMQESYEEIWRVLSLMNLEDRFRVFKGAEKALENETGPIISEGAEFIVEEAMKEEGPLYIACMGAITNVASAILMEPAILKKDIKIIWIGGGDYPDGRWEYNLKNDINAANVVFKSGIEIWQIPRDIYRMMPVSFAELYHHVYPCGKIGEYLTTNVVDFNNADASRPTEYRILGDSPSVGIMLYEDCGRWRSQKRPYFNPDMTYNYSGDYGDIRVYEDIDSRFILEDLYAKLKDYSVTVND